MFDVTNEISMKFEKWFNWLVLMMIDKKESLEDHQFIVEFHFGNENVNDHKYNYINDVEIVIEWDGIEDYPS